MPTTYLQLPESTFGGPTTNSTLTVASLTVDGPNVRLTGQIGYTGKSYPIDLEGVFYKSRIGHESDKVATTRDLTGNFSVLHMAVRRNPSKDLLITNSSLKGPVFFLYLVREGTRELTVIEVPIQELAEEKLQQILKGSRETGHFAADYWAQKLFTPISKGEEPRVQFVEDTDPRVHAETYQQTPSCSLTYKISFQAYTNGPSGIGIGSGDFNHQLKVTRKWTESNCPIYVTESSPFVLGTYSDPIKVLLRAAGDGSNYGDVFLKGRYSGTFTTKATFPASVTLRLGVTIYKTFGINGGLTLCCTQSESTGIDVIYPQGSDWTKRVEHTYTDRYLPNAGQDFTAVVQVAWGEGTYGSRETRAEWTVPVYADWDDLSSTLYYRQTYYPTTQVYYYSGN